MTLRAASAGATCPACGVGAPAGARFSLAGLEAAGHRLEQLLCLADLAPALRRADRASEADAAAKRVLEDATAIGAHALVRRLARQRGDGR